MGARASAIEELTARRDDTRNPITIMNLDNQIRELKAGGTPVQTTFAAGGSRAGEILTVGVVRGGRYSGRQGFDPSEPEHKDGSFCWCVSICLWYRGGVSTGGSDRWRDPQSQQQLHQQQFKMQQTALYLLVRMICQACSAFYGSSRS